MLADGTDPEADCRLEDDDPRENDGRQREPDEEVQLAERSLEKGAEPLGRDACEPVEVHVGNLRQVARRPLVSVRVDVDVARDSQREEVDRRSANDRSERRWIEKAACTSASAAPASMPMSMPRTHEPVLSAPYTPKNAPISIIPSRPMLTTPLRSENRPPIAANVSGVAKRSVAAREPTT